jgi:hypothetical protein
VILSENLRKSSSIPLHNAFMNKKKLKLKFDFQPKYAHLERDSCCLMVCAPTWHTLDFYYLKQRSHDGIISASLCLSKCEYA